MLKTQAQIISGYSLKINAVNRQIEQTKKLIDQLSFVRIGLFLLEILLFILLLNSNEDSWRTMVQILLTLPVIGFAIVVRKQSQLDQNSDYLKQLLWVYQNEWNLLSGLENGYDDGKAFESESHSYTSDLDIFGNASLFGLINRCITKNGRQLLAARLSQKITAGKISFRQEAVKDVLSKIDSTFDFRANLHGRDVTKIEEIKLQLNDQLGHKVAFTNGKFLRFYVAAVPYISALLLISALFLGGLLWTLLSFYFIIHIVWNVVMASKVNKVFYSFSGSSGTLNGYARAISWTETQQWNSNYIHSISDSKNPVSAEIKQLSKIIQDFDARLNLLVGGVLNAVLLWDLRCCMRLSDWLQVSSKNVVNALNHLGNFEELISFATLAHNHPDWTFPDIQERFTLEAKQLGHPLVAAENRVCNDFSLGTMPTVDIVTGSNMAGKSTFLRTVGINMVLAYAGGPVCAKFFSVSVFSINSYMRIKDSLKESTSTFKAELDRLKMILNNLVTVEDSFVLIDEMLRGTNSRDKYQGSKVFAEKLIREKVPALFATHDLQLAELQQEHPDAVRNYHFDIRIAGGEMMFDYKLKSGPCATFNAALLLEQIGLKLNEVN